mmetsp:Transcript_106856/g.300426  ORF Transcript_106856/g.300426 Transcript_106856/m.300426 type:complete len:300 (-) Transcript_106856:13-912(-)
MRGARGLRGVAQALRHEQTLGPGSLLGFAPNDTAATVRRLGAAGLPRVLSCATAQALRDFIQAELLRCRAAVVENPVRRDDWFTPGIYQLRAEARAPQTRWELRLPLAPVVREGIREALFESDSPLGKALPSLVGGDRAELWELTAMISTPGAAPQQVHCDEFYTKEPHLFSVLVALQDVTYEMGPTRFLLGTNHGDAHERFQESPAAFIRDASCAVALLAVGDASVYDGRTLHCGGANRSNSERVLFNVTFCHADSPHGLDRALLSRAGDEDTRSLRSELRPLRLRLGHLRSVGRVPE